MGIDNLIESIFGYYIPVSGTTYRYWENQDKKILESAFKKIKDNGGNLWVFGWDEKIFIRFSEYGDMESLSKLNSVEFSALISW